MENDACGQPPACCRCHAQKLRCIRTRHQEDCNRCKRAEACCTPRPSKRIRKSASTKVNGQNSQAAISPPPTTTDSSVVSSEELYRDWPHDSDSSLNSTNSNFTPPDPTDRQYQSPSDPFGIWGGVDSMQQYFPYDFVPDFHPSEFTSSQFNLDKRSQAAPIASTDSTFAVSAKQPSNISTADSWACDLAGLNVKLFLHKMSISEAIRSLQNTDTISRQPTQQDTSPASADEPRNGRHATQPHLQFPVDETLRLALEFLRLLEALSSPVTNSPSDSMPLSANPDSQQRLVTVSSTNRGMNSTRARIHVDQASRILLLSCYTCLLASLCEMFTSLQHLLGNAHAVQTPTRLSLKLHSTLPSIDIGSLSLDPAPELRATIVLALAQSLVDDISLKFKTTLSTRKVADGNTDTMLEEREGRSSTISSFRSERGGRYELGNDGADNATWEAVCVEHDVFSRHAANLRQSLIGRDS